MSQTDRLAHAFETQALALPESGAILVIRAEAGAFLDSAPRDRLICEQSFRPDHDALESQGFRVTSRASEPAAMVIVSLTRARAENLGNVARGLGLLTPGGRLIVTGAKTDGVDSLAKQVGRAIPLLGQETKAHGRTFWLDRPESPPPEVAEWAAGAEPARNAAGFLTAPGMFSPDAPDPGSRRLAEHFAGRLKGRVADLGAGWGWLSHAALAACPEISRIDLHEAEARALELARLNVPDPRAGFHWSDVARLGRAAEPFDAVIANPPFHQGRAAEPELGAAFIAAAARLLRPSGRFLMVANRQLPYESVLGAHFIDVESLAEDPGYKVIEARRPRRR